MSGMAQAVESRRDNANPRAVMLPSVCESTLLGQAHGHDLLPRYHYLEYGSPYGK
jgi:hypothetical protein